MKGAPIAFAGEGPNELGSRARERMYQEDAQPGVLQTLARRIQPEGWHVGLGIVWSRIRKLDSHRRMNAEVRNVLVAALDAREAGCSALVFARDTDGDEDRRRDIEQGAQQAVESFRAMGAAHPRLEAWILALTGETHTEDRGHIDERLAEAGVDKKDTARMVAVVEAADLGAMPEDAHSLRAWLSSVRRELPLAVSEHAARAPE